MKSKQISFIFILCCIGLPCAIQTTATLSQSKNQQAMQSYVISIFDILPQEDPLAGNVSGVDTQITLNLQEYRTYDALKRAIKNAAKKHIDPMKKYIFADKQTKGISNIRDRKKLKQVLQSNNLALYSKEAAEVLD